MRISLTLSLSLSLSPYVCVSVCVCVCVCTHPGYTALMLATKRNHVLAVKELLYAGADPRVQRRGKTAEMMAASSGNADLAALIKNGGDEPEDDVGEEDEGELSDGAVEGETSTQRSRRKKREMKERDQERFGDLTIGGGSGEEERKQKAAAAEEETNIDETAAKWDEVRAVLTSMKDVNSSTKELVVDRQLNADESVDSMLWSCSCLNLLNLHLTRESDDAPSPLVHVPDGLLNLTGLLTLIMNGNRIRELPQKGLGNLKTLRCLELSGNCIVDLPESLGELTTLETIDVSNNQLTSIDQMKKLDNLTSIKADANAIESIENLKLKNKQRLEHLSLSSNKLASIPDDIQHCKQLKRLLLLDNATLKALPSSLSNNKKLQTIRIDAKSLEDSKVRPIRHA